MIVDKFHLQFYFVFTVQLSLLYSLSKNIFEVRNVKVNVNVTDEVLVDRHFSMSKDLLGSNLKKDVLTLFAITIFIYFSADEKFDGTFQTNVVVSDNGTCLYVPPGIFKSTCKIDIAWFPFDDQKCDLKFGSWTYNGWKVNINSNSL